jgi:hypothetical protein
MRSREPPEKSWRMRRVFCSKGSKTSVQNSRITNSPNHHLFTSAFALRFLHKVLPRGGRQPPSPSPGHTHVSVWCTQFPSHSVKAAHHEAHCEGSCTDESVKGAETAIVGTAASDGWTMPDAKKGNLISVLISPPTPYRFVSSRSPRLS